MDSTKAPDSVVTIPEYHRLEIEEIFARSRSLTAIRVQMFVFVGTANITALGFAFSSQKAVVILLGSVLVLLLMLANSQLRRNLRAVYARGLALEQRYAPDSENALLRTYISVAATQYTQAADLMDANLEEDVVQIRKLRLFRASFVGLFLPLSVILAQVIGACILLLFAGWSLY